MDINFTFTFLIRNKYKKRYITINIIYIRLNKH